MKDHVLAAIRLLPDHERTVTTLFYINGYSQQEIAAFLEVPITTVQKRMQYARQHLKEGCSKSFVKIWMCSDLPVRRHLPLRWLKC